MNMKAIQIDQYGGTDNLQYRDIQRPTPAAGEVLIRAEAASVNPFDCAVRQGYLSGWYTYQFPLTLGVDVAGEIVECGEGVTRFSPGDAVFARTDPGRSGAYAQYVLARQEDVASMPGSLGPVQAAALPHAAITAWALVDGANLSAGQTVLIHGAAGGVGHLAVQLAKLRGARVIGTASENNHRFLRDLGVDEVVDYTKTPFESAARDVDAVFDTIGGETQQRSWAILKPGGILLSLIQPPDQNIADAHGVRQKFISDAPPGGELLTRLAAMVDAGQLSVTVSTVLPLTQVRQAHEMVQGKHMRGKLVLEIMQ